MPRWSAPNLARARAATANDRSLITHLKLEIEKLRRAIYGPRSERTARLLDQLELQLEEAEADATEDELAAEQATRSTPVKSFERKRPSRKPFPDHLPRERSSFPRRRLVRAAVRPNCRSSAKTSRRRWRSSRGNGR